jgi:hypothetical protein
MFPDFAPLRLTESIPYGQTLLGSSAEKIDRKAGAYPNFTCDPYLSAVEFNNLFDQR